jgi:hypothetical protein
VNAADGSTEARKIENEMFASFIFLNAFSDWIDFK